jgi:hypothetical protein
MRSWICPRYVCLLLVMMVLWVGVWGGTSGLAQGGAPPPGPMGMSGEVRQGGAIASDGLTIVGRILGSDYETDPGITRGGRYFLTVSPTQSKYLSQDFLRYSQVEFFLKHPGADIFVKADQIVVWVGGPTDIHQDLTFLAFPGVTSASAPTAATVAIPVPTPHPMWLLQAVDSQDSSAVWKQLKSGIDLDNVFVPEGDEFSGASALHMAVLKNNQEIVNILLEGGTYIDIRARDMFHGTPLDWAAFWGLEEMVVLLVQNGADVNSKTTLGTTPLDTAGAENHFVKPDDRVQFEKDRALIREFLASQGASSGKVTPIVASTPQSKPVPSAPTVVVAEIGIQQNRGAIATTATNFPQGKSSGGCGRQSGGPMAGDLSYALGGMALLGLILRRQKY